MSENVCIFAIGNESLTDNDMKQLMVILQSLLLAFTLQSCTLLFGPSAETRRQEARLDYVAKHEPEHYREVMDSINMVKGYNQEIVRVQSEHWWNDIRHSLNLTSHYNKWPTYLMLLLGLLGLWLLTVPRYSLMKGGVVLVMGLLELYHFLGFTGYPAWFFGSEVPWLFRLLFMGLLVGVLIIQLLLTDQATLPDSLQDSKRAAVDDMFVGLYFVFVLGLGVVLLFITGKVFSFSGLTTILNWLIIFGWVSGVIWLIISKERQGVLMVLPVVVSFAGIAVTMAYCSWSGVAATLILLVLFAYKSEKSNVTALENRTKSGDPESMVELASMIRKGKLNDRPLSEAVALYQKAMDKGYAPAFNGLGIMYRQGKGVPFNPQKALQLCRKSYDLGNLKACLQIGELYAEEKYGMQNKYEAWNWFLKGGQGGEMPCMLKVALALQNGEGVVRDDYTALVWAEKAANHPADVHGDGAYLAASIAHDIYDRQKARHWIEIAKRKGNPLAIKYYNLYAS